MRRTRGILGAAAVGSVVAAAALGRDITRFEIADRSMSPALEPGDYIVTLRRHRAPRRGDVVVFGHPTRDGLDLVKRVVGLPTEHVEIVAERVVIDGVVLEEPWATGATAPAGSWMLGRDEVFVLGDRRLDSADDSRTIGPVLPASIAGTAVVRYWPLRTAGRIGRSGSSH